MDLVSIQGQFPGIGQKFQCTSEGLSKGYAAGYWVCPWHIRDNCWSRTSHCTDIHLGKAQNVPGTTEVGHEDPLEGLYPAQYSSARLCLEQGSSGNSEE